MYIDIMVVNATCFAFREKETQILKEQIDKLNSSIITEEAKAKELEIKSRYRLFSKSRTSITISQYRSQTTIIEHAVTGDHFMVVELNVVM